jgi:hypothetical protein
VEGAARGGDGLLLAASGGSERGAQDLPADRGLVRLWTPFLQPARTIAPSLSPRVLR